MEQLKYTIVQTNNKGQVDEECDLFGSSSSSSSEFEISSGSSLDSDSFEEVTSPATSSSSSSAHQLASEPLNDMSSLFQQLPIKRGLSKYYEGKAQSFSSLAKVRSVEDLAKPENPYKKKLKCYGGGMRESERGDRGSQGSCSSMSAKSGSDNFMGTRPPISPHASTTTIPNQTPLKVKKVGDLMTGEDGNRSPGEQRL
ncbi:hypothetical protein RJT34_11462 [Clitoria ternatea]|uniref:Oxidative stress 3 n=1 Tax=Clitoria ternatea TaxID=43366 RepID=A0AAN9JLY8_CLITE